MFGFFAVGIAEAGDDHIACVYIFLFGVVIGGDDDLCARGFGGFHTVLGIFHHEDFIGCQSQLGERQVVDFRIGLLVLDHIACQHDLELDIRQDFLGDGFGGLFIGCGADADLEPASIASFMNR